jgi:hypothetical protein
MYQFSGYSSETNDLVGDLPLFDLDNNDMEYRFTRGTVSG